MTINEALRAVDIEYSNETTEARHNARLNRAMTNTLHREFEEIDKELPDVVADIARGMGVPSGTTLPGYVYQVARMCFRLGMRVQRKIDNPNEETTTFWRLDRRQVDGSIGS